MPRGCGNTLPNCRPRQSISAFTLIELLVVISIIALLTAILLPVFFSVRGRARQTVCISNLRQIGMAISLYADENDDLYPAGKDPSDVYATPDIWTGSPYQAQVHQMPFLNDILAPYIHSPQLWHCPADSGYKGLDISEYAGGFPVPIDATPTAYEKYHTSYLYRTEIALLNTKYGALAAYDPLPPYAEHENAEVNVLMDGSGSWHGGYLVSQKRYDELMGDGHVVNQNIAQFGQTWRLQLRHP